MKSIISLVYVGVGGLLGTLLRYGFSLILQKFSFTIPFGTLFSNLSGCFCIGIMAGLIADSSRLSPDMRLFFVTGFCGGFTTLSSLIYELVQMLRNGQHFIASLYITLTFVGSVLMFFAGAGLIKFITRA